MLFEPFRLGSLTLANRIVMAPLTRSRAAAVVSPAASAAAIRRLWLSYEMKGRTASNGYDRAAISAPAPRGVASSLQPMPSHPGPSRSGLSTSLVGHPHATPPISFDPPHYLVGCDAGGHWLAVEAHGSGGGLFVSRDAALRYARGETGRRPGAVDVVERLTLAALTG